MQVEKPTVRMTFSVNTSPFAGREGKYVTSRNIKDRLDRELERNLALTVESGETADQFVVSGRGALHISILIENMRREGFEFQVGPPRVRHSLPEPQARQQCLRLLKLVLFWSVPAVLSAVPSRCHVRVMSLCPAIAHLVATEALSAPSAGPQSTVPSGPWCMAGAFGT